MHNFTSHKILYQTEVWGKFVEKWCGNCGKVEIFCGKLVTIGRLWKTRVENVEKNCGKTKIMHKMRGICGQTA